MSAINFNTSNQTYRQLMGNGLLYTVPKFQRDYSWTDAEWDDFWEDIQNLMAPDGESAHYMGYLVLQSTDNKHFSIIDGQQRLTTMSILVLAVLDGLNRFIAAGIEPDDNSRRLEQLRNTFVGYLDPVTLIPKPKLTLNRNNNFYYQNYLLPLQENMPIRHRKATEHLMRKAFEFFKSKVWAVYGPQKQGAQFAQLLDTLADRLFFTVIVVNNELNAYKVFETLNARGVKLSATDLLKNYLFSTVHRELQDDVELHALEERWEALVGKMGSESFPDFLRTHWNSRHRFARHSDLFKTIRGQISGKKEVFELIRAMEEDADVYAALSSPEDVLWNTVQRGYIEEMKMYNVRQAYPLLLAARRAFPEADFTTTLKVCSVISFRYNVIGNLLANEQERVYTSAAEQVAGGSLKNIQELISALRPIYPSDDAFEVAFKDKVLKTTLSRNKKIVRYILFQLEKHLSGQEIDRDSDLYSIEHVLPENPDTGWDAFGDQEHEEFVYRLGNMLPLKADKNRNIGNIPYSEKRAVLLASNFQLTQKIAEKYAEWTPKQIADTQQWMAAQAKSIWKITQMK